MEFEWNSRPVSVVHRPPGWTERPESGPGSSNLSSTYYSQRRRSTIAPVPPPGPPPSQPIPNLPFSSSGSPPPQEYLQDSRLSSVHLPALNGSGASYNAYSRPAASANLAAVAAFSQSRSSPSPSYPQSNLPPTASSSSSPYSLSDSPPRSQLRQAMESQHQEIIPERLQLSPSEGPSSNERRPSSRRALTRALELAREAVRLDSANDNPHAAVAAYGRSVSLLSEVMERVMRGEDSTESHRRRNGRRRSVVAQEEEVKRLKSIHDTYAERMEILCTIYDIPVDSLPFSAYPSTVYTLNHSTQPPSPVSTSPSETSDNPSQSSSTEDLHDDPRSSVHTVKLNGVREHEDGTEAIGSAMFNLDVSGSNNGHELTRSVPIPHAMSEFNSTPTTATPKEIHPQAMTNGGPIGRPRTSTLPLARGVVTQAGPTALRSRASTTLPPPAPPPTNSLPPAPARTTDEYSEPPSSRSRGGSISHKRTGSGSRLGPLREEVERREEITLTVEEELRRPRSKSVLAAQRHYNDSQPLPPLPAQVDRSGSPATPRHVKHTDPTMPSSPDLQYARSRGDSTLSGDSDASVPSSFHPPVINNSPFNGTISQRRGKTSAPPSISASPNPESSQSSSASVPTMNRLTSQSILANTAVSLGVGRARAASQPGRRPSLVSTQTYPFPTQSPTVTQNSTTGPRKVSVPSKLNPNAPPQITINTALLTPPTATTANMLVPPPPIPHENFPSAPLSPLPPAPPPDPLRKPYHMMNLLRYTMTSKTGGYVTRRLHVPYEVWSQGGAKLSNVPEKIRVVEVLLSAFEEVQNCSDDIFGAGNVSSGLVLGIGSIGQKEGEAWASKLDEFSAVCDGLVSNFGKKLGVGEGFVIKKGGGLNAWGNKLTRQFDKLTTGKNLDSPTTYVHGLANLFFRTQLLDEHTKALSLIPVAPAYAAFSVEMRTALEAKLRHASEFFARVVLTFVIRDLSQLLDKYVKKCEKWLAE